MIALPVLEDKAEVEYHTAHSRMNRKLPVMASVGSADSEESVADVGINPGLRGWRYAGDILRMMNLFARIKDIFIPERPSRSQPRVEEREGSIGRRAIEPAVVRDFS